MAFTRDVREVIEEHAIGMLAINPEWERVRLGDVATIKNGAAFKSRYFNTECDGMPLLRIRDVLPGRTETYYNGPYDDGYLVEKGDLVIGMDGDFHCRIWPGPAALLNQRVCRVDFAPQGLNPEFAALALPTYLKVVNDATPSITVKHLSSKTVADLRFPCPSPVEQEQVIRTLQEEHGRADIVQKEIEAVDELVQQFGQALLRDAYTGKLVRVAEHPPGMGIPSHWRSLKLFDIAQIKGGAGFPKHLQGRSAGEVPFAKVSDISRAVQENAGFLSAAANYISKAEAKQLRAPILPPGTIVTAKIGEAVRLNRRALLTVSSTVDNNVMGLVPNQKIVTPKFLWYWSKDKKFDDLAKATAVPSIRKSAMEELPISIPPLEEQVEIVDAIESSLANVGQVQDATNSLHTYLDQLRKAVLHRAVSGELRLTTADVE